MGRETQGQEGKIADGGVGGLEPEEIALDGGGCISNVYLGFVFRHPSTFS